VGGVIGHQIGSGRGNTAATVAGAAGGAYAGHQIEKNKNTKVSYQVVLKMDSGDTRYFNFSQPTSYKIGDKIKIVDKKLVRQ
jgi:outer membrane lipoprotein SlyB